MHASNTISIEKGAISVEQAKRVKHMQPVLVPLSHKIGTNPAQRQEPGSFAASAKATSPMLPVTEATGVAGNPKVGVEGAEVEGIFNTFRADGQSMPTTYEPTDQELQADLKNFEEYSKAHNMLVGHETQRSQHVTGRDNNERVTGYPNPKAYD